LNAVVEHNAQLWEPRRSMTLAQARRRTGLVGVMRMGFTVGAAVSAGVMLGYLIAHALVSLNEVAPPPARGVTMLNPRFNGRDANDQPFIITAATAKQRRGEKQAVDLESPVLEDSMGTVVSAADGVYDRAARTLLLNGDVELLDASGYRFTSESATMYVQDNRIEGDTPLTGGGPLGEVRADTYKLENGGQKVILIGNVWTRIIPQDEPEQVELEE